ncbi:MAG: FAD-dependent oxidoreductase [Pseudomonadota bacterium]|nr:FAD-dependent oxidoreductase [Pseudomonadota bacterium]
MKLLEPMSLGLLRLRNRIVMPPMATLYGAADGTVSETLYEYYLRRARGGVGMVIVENTAPTAGTVNYPNTLEIHDPVSEPGLARLAAGIKSAGAAAAIQLFHPGRQMHPKYTGNTPVAPSAIPCPVMRAVPRPLDIDDIRQLVEDFVQGAVRARAVGFDAVEIHAAHGYLVGQFLSPLANQRSDAYGGNTERRARFAVEIGCAIRERLGDDFPLLLRFSADEKTAGGLTLAESRRLIPFFVKAGYSALHVSAGCYPSMAWVVQPYLQTPGCLADLAAAVRNETHLPVIAVGRINEPAIAEAILQEGSADLVSMGRALIADPDLPRKALAGQENGIRPCLACNVCIQAVGHGPTRCAVNAEMGRETEQRPATAAPVRMLVVGGGPAGMEAAQAAAQKGHRVTLVERTGELGGQLGLAAGFTSKPEFGRLLNYYRNALARFAVDVILNTEADARFLEDFSADRLIIATGAVPRPLAGIATAANVRIFQALEILERRTALCGDVVVVGGGLLGMDTAEFLSTGADQVTVLEAGRRVGRSLEWNVRGMRLKALNSYGVRTVEQAALVRLERGRAVYCDQAGVEHTQAADAVVLALGLVPHNPFGDTAAGLASGITLIGDCAQPAGITAAISQGRLAGSV